MAFCLFLLYRVQDTFEAVEICFFFAGNVRRLLSKCKAIRMAGQQCDDPRVVLS